MSTSTHEVNLNVLSRKSEVAAAARQLSLHESQIYGWGKTPPDLVL
ncbi:DNA-binding transcriptional regulator Cro [Vibrio crassostreae]|nr:DNA-binding transcriptional regulator Cro [Vibrio crassostreae]CAK1697474.1 DNA-binding transcriptional regulator Cro [Vibrio crassostreae]CAK1697551.1 DNA-binding transcriptional regulator Cro [Vibrio crassostreae]CAK1714915.1 DNA-binding transcriptional regulator Cro [Vibrio crassostreae]CAK1738332.1 DNA-binding transcriptional regulator Cro [Vibrio crassostreae]